MGHLKEVFENERARVKQMRSHSQADLPAGLDVRADSKQLFQANTNLVRNAR